MCTYKYKSWKSSKLKTFFFLSHQIFPFSRQMGIHGMPNYFIRATFASNQHSTLQTIFYVQKDEVDSRSSHVWYD